MFFSGSQSSDRPVFQHGRSDLRCDEACDPLAEREGGAIVNISSQLGLENNPQGQRFAMGDGVNMYAPHNTLAAMSPSALAPTGSNLPHNNMQPYLTLNFCIAMQGIFPPRS